MSALTFYSNIRYAGGRSHVNIHKLEYVYNKDILEAAEYYGYHLYPTIGEDFEGGINDEAGNQVWDAEDVKEYTKAGISSLDLGETTFYSTELKDIDVKEFKVLPQSVQLEYINIWNPNVTDQMLEFAKESESIEQVFDYAEKEWQIVAEEMKEQKEE